MKNNNSFWNKFYINRKKTFLPSNFAKFVNRNYILKNQKKSKSLIDIGCGDGRDALFFARTNLKVIAIDSSESVININKTKSGFLRKNPKFICSNVSSTNHLIFKNKYDYVYCRFFLHAIDQKKEKILFKLLKKIIKNKTKIFFEFRTMNDPLMKKGKKLSYNERITDHYRRFIDLDKLIKKLIKENIFKIIYIKESFGFSKTKNDNPCLCRLVLEKK